MEVAVAPESAMFSTTASLCCRGVQRQLYIGFQTSSVDVEVLHLRLYFKATDNIAGDTRFQGVQTSCARFGAPAEEVNGKLRLLHRMATALALMPVGALVSLSKLSLRMWGEITA
jgi:hypothetical protein